MSGDVSVVIPCRNEHEHIGKLLQALLAQHARPAEVVIVDGGSTDGTVGVIRAAQAAHPELSMSVISLPGASIPAGVNAGIEAARGDVIVRLDAHSYPDPDYISKAVQTPEIGLGVVGGVWNVVPGADTVTARAIAVAVSHPLGAGDAAYRLASSDEEPSTVDTVPFGCFLKSLWRELGGLNERLLTNEDYEFNYRARLSGRPVILHRGMRCTYFSRATLADLARQYFRYGWWKIAMLKLHPASLRWRQALPVLFVAGLVLLLAASVLSPLFWPALGLAGMGYALALATAAVAGARSRQWSIVSVLPAAFAVIHLAWGTGALVNLLTLGRWPTWTLPMDESEEPCSR